MGKQSTISLSAAILVGILWWFAFQTVSVDGRALSREDEVEMIKGVPTFCILRATTTAGDNSTMEGVTTGATDAEVQTTTAGSYFAPLPDDD